MSLVKNTDTLHQPHIVVNTVIPWSVHHENTVILQKEFSGMVYLKTVSGLYQLGNSDGLQAPVMLGKLLKCKQKKPSFRSVTQLVSIVLRRFQDQTDIPDVQGMENEKLVRAVVWGVAKKIGAMQRWLEMERDRMELLIKSFDLENLKLIYPMIKQDPWPDVLKAYQQDQIPTVNVPDEAFAWLVNMLL